MKHFLWPPFLAMFGVFLFAPAGWGGYTHYFTWHGKPDQAQLKKCLAKMRLVVDAARKDLAGPDGEGDPLVEPLQLQINGKGKDAHEPFYFPGQEGLNFCKTLAKPYDCVVTACLLVARDHFPEKVLEIASDGSWSEGDWAAGQALYEQVFGTSARNPMGSNNGGAEEGGLSPYLLVGILAGGVIFLLWVRKKAANP